MSNDDTPRTDPHGEPEPAEAAVVPHRPDAAPDPAWTQAEPLPGSPPADPDPAKPGGFSRLSGGQGVLAAVVLAIVTGVGGFALGHATADDPSPSGRFGQFGPGGNGFPDRQNRGFDRDGLQNGPPGFDQNGSAPQNRGNRRQQQQPNGDGNGNGNGNPPPAPTASPTPGATGT